MRIALAKSNMHTNDDEQVACLLVNQLAFGGVARCVSGGGGIADLSLVTHGE